MTRVGGRRGWLFACSLGLAALAASGLHASGTVTYTYDPLGRLTSAADSTDLTCISYYYDAAGNRTQLLSTGPGTPVANNASITTAANTPVTFDPRVDARSPSCYPLTITSVTAPNHGTAVVINSGTAVTYTPAANYTGPDNFNYTVSDGHGGTASATISVSFPSPPDGTVLFIQTSAGGFSYTMLGNSTPFADVEIWGPGGGGQNKLQGFEGAGGGGGGYSKKHIAVTPGVTVVSGTVGAIGMGVSGSAGNGTSGAPTSVSTPALNANGGGGGAGAHGGAGGTASGGDVNTAGSAGSNMVNGGAGANGGAAQTVPAQDGNPLGGGGAGGENDIEGRSGNGAVGEVKITARTS